MLKLSAAIAAACAFAASAAAQVSCGVTDYTTGRTVGQCSDGSGFDVYRYNPGRSEVYITPAPTVREAPAMPNAADYLRPFQQPAAPLPAAPGSVLDSMQRSQADPFWRLR